MQTSTPTTKTRFSARFIARAGILAGISVILSFIPGIPLPFIPPFLTIDFSNIPILIGTFTFGPITGICIALVKSLIHLCATHTGGVGELADFLTALALLLPSSLLYLKKKTRTNAVIGMILGAVCMAIVGGLANKFLLIPFYAKVMPLEQIFTLCAKANSFIKDTNTYVLYGAVPFNFIKAAIICIPTFILYKSISKILRK